jgi:hypothetical protein
MKNKYSNGRLTYFFTPRIHGNVLAWKKPASKSERSKQVTENILRWEDDGGPVSETATPLPQVPETNTVRPINVGPGTGRRTMNVGGKGS